MRSNKKRGMGLLELMMTLTLFSLLVALSVQVLSKGINSWNQVMSGEGSTLELAKVYNRLERDLRDASLNQMGIRGSRSSLSGAPDGHALWFLSSKDPATGQQVRDSLGQIFWQRNILYYLVVPNNHAQLFGYNCAGGAGPLGLDDRCPHKMLIRKVIDSGSATTADPTASPPESLLSGAQIGLYLTRPAGNDLSAMSGEPGLEQYGVAANLLYFSAQVRASATVTDELLIDIRSFETKYAERGMAIGSAPLADHPRTNTRLHSFFPNNP